jgi:hypothetical protein
MVQKHLPLRHEEHKEKCLVAFVSSWEIIKNTNATPYRMALYGYFQQKN